MIGVRRRFAIGGAQGGFVNDHSNHAKFCSRDDGEQVTIKCCALLFILQNLKHASSVDDLFTVQDDRVIRVMMEMLCFESLQCFMKLEISGILKPASQQTQKPMSSIGRFPKYMVARFVQIETIAVLKL